MMRYDNATPGGTLSLDKIQDVFFELYISLANAHGFFDTRILMALAHFLYAATPASGRQKLFAADSAATPAFCWAQIIAEYFSSPSLLLFGNTRKD